MVKALPYQNSNKNTHMVFQSIHSLVFVANRLLVDDATRFFSFAEQFSANSANFRKNPQNSKKHL